MSPDNYKVNEIYKRSEVRFSDMEGVFLAKSSCNRCHGTGIVCWKLSHPIKKEGERKPTYQQRIPVYCDCLIEQEVKEEASLIQADTQKESNNNGPATDNG